MTDAKLREQQPSSSAATSSVATQVATNATTRRALVARNVRAIGVLAASAALAKLLAPTRAFALAPPPCFQKGTKIETVLGERKVEDLAVGDLLPTQFGGVRPIQWIARARRTKEAGRPWKEHARPIRIKRSALAMDVPHSDLFVTSEHALLIDGSLVCARRLINGTTIAPFADDACDELEFFHIKLATHDVIYAEGAPCETLLSVDEAASNFAEYLRIHGAPATPDVPCAPIYGRGALTEITSRLRRLMSPGLGAEPVDLICDRLEQRASERLTPPCKSVD